MSESDFDARNELSEIVSELREQLRWQLECGASGVLVAEPGPLRDAAPAPAPMVHPVARREHRPEHAPAPSPGQRPSPPPSPPSALYEPAADHMTEEQRRAELAELEKQAALCAKCVLHEQRKQAVFARGNPVAEVMIVGEGPGADEDDQGEPFVGKAGLLLDRMIAAMGYGRDEVYIANIVKCRPPRNRTPEPDEIAACMPYLARQIELVSPRVIMAMGATAIRGLLGVEGITRMRGKWKLYRGRVPVMPTFHPAYVLRQESAKRDVWSDLKEVMRHLGRPIPAPKK